MEASRRSRPPTCRVAIVGAKRQRVAKIVALLRDDKSRERIVTKTLSQSSKGDANAAIVGMPANVDIEYLPCVATFDSYDDEFGANVRYLSRLEYHGPNGTLVGGKSLAPYFDDVDPVAMADDDGEGEGDANDGDPLPGISSVAIGCGIEDDDDVEKITRFFEACSSSTKASDGRCGMIIECMKANPPYASIAEENEAYRRLSNENEREGAISNGAFGPGKMVNFIHDIAKLAIRQRWEKEYKRYEEMLVPRDPLSYPADEESSSTDDVVTISPEGQCTVAYTPNPDLTRYACKSCRTPLFGEDDLEDPPHGQSLHNFRKKMHKVGYHGNSSSGSCQNHFVGRPLPWMNGCPGVEGKMHCPKCRTKVGHYSWTGAQCSCGTWITPAIMIPSSKVDEMRPTTSQMDVTAAAATGSLVVDRFDLMVDSLHIRGG
jgi:dual specificity phosphatase 12